MMTTTLKIVIGQMMKDNPKFKEGYIRAHWKDVVGNLESKSSIYYLKGKNLVVKVDNSTVLQFMKMNSKIYSEKIENLLSEISSIEEKENLSQENRFEISFRIGKI